jgi:hypothetical protein
VFAEVVYTYGVTEGEKRTEWDRKYGLYVIKMKAHYCVIHARVSNILQPMVDCVQPFITLSLVRFVSCGCGAARCYLEPNTRCTHTVYHVTMWTERRCKTLGLDPSQYNFPVP